ncbi:hypothetical protein IV102_35450 [bacterium]|nr:hypothetical protein [bacterium]
MKTSMVFITLLLPLGVVWARPTPPGTVQKPVNNPRPGQATTTAVPAAPMFFSGTLVNRFSQELTVDGGSKKQTFRVSERSQIPPELKTGAQVVVTYTTSPQGPEVVRVVARPAKPGQ